MTVNKNTNIIEQSKFPNSLDTLYKISQILAAGLNQRQTLAEVLDMLDNELGMKRGTIDRKSLCFSTGWAGEKK